MTPADFFRAVEAAVAALAPISICPEDLHIHTPTNDAIAVARELPGAVFTRYGAARTSPSGRLVVTVGGVKVTLHGVGPAVAPPKLTKPQMEALRALGDGLRHETATVTHKPHDARAFVGGAVVRALVTHGYAERVVGSSPSAYTITAAGRLRLSQEASCSKP